MPRGDRTGPLGLGPMTGRAAGYCAGYPVPGYMNPIPGRGWGWFGFGRGWGRGFGWFGRGRGWRHWYWATGIPGWARGVYPYYEENISPQDEVKVLKEQADFLQEQLKAVQKRMEELESKQENK